MLLIEVAKGVSAAAALGIPVPRSKGNSSPRKRTERFSLGTLGRFESDRDFSSAPVPETCDDGTAYVPVGLCDSDRPRCGVGDRKALERVITHIVAARESVKTAGLHTLPTHAEVLPPDAGRLPTSRGSRSWTTSRGTPLRSSSICVWPTSRPATGCGDRRTLCVARPLCQGGERVIRATATQGLGVVQTSRPFACPAVRPN